jgi:serine/threonine-protein kinase
MSAPVIEGEIVAGKYKVERVLARGGMGVVVAAIHQQLEQRVALKFLLPGGVQCESIVARFLREAKAAVRLRSEHVARVLDVGTAEDGAPYIVMEYLEGQDLATVIDAQGQLPIDEAIPYVLQACEAIAEAHALGIVHRDLKPANLFLTRRPDGSPCVKVLDFGISKIRSPGMSQTSTQTVMGTPFYMAPEILMSSKDADARSDIWAIGMILYELLTGQVAFERDTLPQLCVAILNDPIPPPSERRPDLPREIEKVIEKTLEKSPAARYQTLAELGAALAPFAEGGSASHQRIDKILKAPPPPSIVAPLPLAPPVVASPSPTPLGPPSVPSQPSQPSQPRFTDDGVSRTLENPSAVIEPEPPPSSEDPVSRAPTEPAPPLSESGMQTTGGGKVGAARVRTPLVALLSAGVAVVIVGSIVLALSIRRHGEAQPATAAQPPGATTPLPSAAPQVAAVPAPIESAPVAPEVGGVAPSASAQVFSARSSAAVAPASHITKKNSSATNAKAKPVFLDDLGSRQ